MKIWFLEESVKARLETATIGNNVVIEATKGLYYSIKGRTGSINVVGVLTAERDPMSVILGYGNTVYSDITAAIGLLKSKGVTSIEFNIDSPGGEFNGLISAMETIRDCGVKTRANVIGNAQSAAYMLAAMCDSVVAANKGAGIGSFGVAVSEYISRSVVDITNRKSKDKRPDVSTESGVAVHEDRLDEVYNLICDYIVVSRGVTKDEINKNYGNGRSFLAAEALRRGMIDAILGENTNVNKEVANVKTLIELMAQYPDLYEEAIKLGQSQEKDRVNAHLEMAKVTGTAGLELATEAIAAGDDFNQTYMAKYGALVAKQGIIDSRDEDSNNVDVAQDTDSSEEKTIDAIFTEAENKLGIESGSVQ